MIKMDRLFRISITFVLMLITTDAIGDDFCTDLQEFYRTKLFAIDTHLSVLLFTEDVSTQTESEISALREERDTITRRLKACEEYNFPHYLTKKDYGTRLSRRDIDLIAERKAKNYGVNPTLVKAIIKAESDYDIYAHSHAGAMGLMQLMPETAEDMGVENPWDPEENIEGGTKYFCVLLREFENVEHALLAYNAGPKVVRKAGRIPSESRHYVKNVLSYYYKISGNGSL